MDVLEWAVAAAAVAEKMMMMKLEVEVALMSQVEQVVIGMGQSPFFFTK